MPHEGNYSTGKKKTKESGAYKASDDADAMVKRAMATLRKSGMFTVTRKKKKAVKKKGNPHSY